MNTNSYAYTGKGLDFEQLAKILYTAHCAYCETLDGSYAHEPWTMAPERQKKWIRDGIRSYLREWVDGGELQPETLHESWISLKRREGWTYGLIRHPAAKEHPCMVSFNNLPVEQRMKSHLFVHICRAFFEVFEVTGAAILEGL